MKTLSEFKKEYERLLDEMQALLMHQLSADPGIANEIAVIREQFSSMKLQQMLMLGTLIKAEIFEFEPEKTDEPIKTS